MDASKYRFSKPTRNNLDKKEASECKHHWAYGGGTMWCLKCGWFQQPDGRITKTPSGKSGEILESVNQEHNTNKNVINLKYDELPKTIRDIIPKINKIIMDKIKEVSADDKYKPLKEDEDFDYKGLIKAISSREHNDVPVGVITKKNDATFKAMIQITGHVSNPNKSDSEKLFHTLMIEVYKDLKPTLKNDLNVDLSNDDFKEHEFEGFDVYTTPDIAKSIWKFHHNSKSGLIQEYQESLILEEDLFEEKSHGKLKSSFRKGLNIENGHMIKVVFDLNTIEINPDKITDSEERKSLLNHVQTKGHNNFLGKGVVKAIIDEDTNERLSSVKLIGLWSDSIFTIPKEIKRGDYNANRLSTYPLETREKITRDQKSNIKNSNDIMLIKVGKEIDNPAFMATSNIKSLDAFADLIDYGSNIRQRGASIKNYLKTKNLLEESANPEYNTDMTELQAKATLRTLSQSLINDLSDESKKKQMSQYTANIYANIITKNLLPKWTNGFNKFKIILDGYQSFHTFEFIPPTMSQDFVSRFINGRESLNGLLHKSPEIKVKMSPRIFHTMKNPDDAFNFFKAAIKYYDSQVEKSGNKLMVEVMKMGHNMKHLIGNSKLSGLVTYPLSLLFVFGDVDMTNKDTFKITNDDIQSINKFVKNISSRYAAPEKEKKQIVEDVKKMVETLRESCESTDNVRSLHYLPEAVENFLFDGYGDMILESSRLFIESQIDRDWNPTPQVKYFKEAWGVKKLKKIPKDLIPYIQIETEAIKDANDKMILSSYTLGKIEIVEWYIELLTVGSKKYIVPHTKPYLELVRSQLLACFKKIMDTSVVKNDKTIDIKYPKGYEG